MRRTLWAVLVAILAGLAATTLPVAHAATWTPSSYASRLITLLNQTRQQHGLPALSVASGTGEVASAWTSHLASAQALSHNPYLAHDLETHGSPDWTSYGENVGDGPANDPNALFQAYMNSTEHRDNILNRAYRFMGVGVVFTGSTAWNTFDFVDTYHSASTTTTSKPKPKPRPSQQVTTTTAAPAHTIVAAQPAAHPAAHAPRHKPAHRRASARVDGLRAVAAPSRLVSGGLSSGGVVAMPPLPSLPEPLPPTSGLVVAIAAGLVGFLGVRWIQVARAA